MKDFGDVIYCTDTKAYIIKNNYTIPHPDDTSIPESVHKEFDEMWYEVSEYAKKNKDKVTEKAIFSTDEITLDNLKSQKLIEINTAYSEAVSSLLSNYPLNEILTFSKQETEARAWIENKNVDTPLIDAIVLGRGIDKEEFVSRILSNAESYNTQNGYFIGLRQKYEDMLEMAHTSEEVFAIIPEYKLSDKLDA